MLAIFNRTVGCGPEELRVAMKSNLDQSKVESASDLLGHFLDEFPHAVSVKMGEMASMAYTHDNQALLHPRSFAAKDDCFCLFEGTLQNLPSLRQQYGLSKSVNEVLLVIEAYKALRDRAPYPATHVVGHLDGRFAFVIFDKTNGTVFAATDSYGKVPFYWGIATDGCLAFSDDGELLRKACGRSLASFPEGCFFSSTAGLRSYQHPHNKVMAIPNQADGEMCGTTFKVERETLSAASINLIATFNTCGPATTEEYEIEFPIPWTIY